MTNTDDWQAEYITWATALQERNSIPGMAIRVFTDDQILFEHGFGYRDREKQLPVTMDTIFGIASVTKSHTALAVLHAASHGLLSLDDAVTRWLPEFTLWQDRRVPTIRNFMNQDSGLPALPTLVHAMDQDLDREVRADTAEEVIAYLNANATLLGDPGTIFCYQNDAWGLLGEVLTRATGVRFEEYLATHVTGPLGMDRTTFDLATVLADDDATVIYTKEDGQVRASPEWSESASLAAAGFLRSTATDLTAYVRFLMRGRGLDIDSGLLQEMQTGAVWCGTDMHYGFGLGIAPGGDGLTYVSHSGGLKGISSHVGFIRELGIGAVVLSNLEEQPAEKLWLGAMNLLLRRDADRPRYQPETEPVSAEDTAAIIGSYRSGEPWGVLEIGHDAAGELQVTVGEDREQFPAVIYNRGQVGYSKPELTVVNDVLRDADGEVYGILHGRRVLLKQG